MSNTQRLLTRIGALRDNLQRVREGLQDADDATLLRDPWRLAAIKWHLLLAIEDAFALCNQTIAILGGDAPTAYAECFEKLAAHGVIDSALAERLKAMARFRNLLLHRYWEVDDRRVLTIARNDLSDLEQFVGVLSVHFNLGG
jgi:uncharacterized protein YutE (UPF0331/DUF86 family)